MLNNLLQNVNKRIKNFYDRNNIINTKHKQNKHFDVKCTDNSLSIINVAK